MNFKEKYSEYQQEIVPDKEFLEKLAEKMERQKKAARQRKRALFISTASLCAAAAAAVVVILNVRGADERVLHVKTNESAISVSTGVFENKTVFNDDAPVPKQLSEMLGKSTSTVYKSRENKFDNSGELSAEQRAELAEKIKAAKQTDTQPSKTAEHYMLVLENGDVVKFIIYGDIMQADGKFFKIC